VLAGNNSFPHRLVRGASSGGATQNAKLRRSAAESCRNRDVPGDDYDGLSNPSGAQKAAHPHWMRWM
jgi:hypothetical protein